MITLGLLSHPWSANALAPAAATRPGKRENILRDFCFKLVFTSLTVGAVFAAGSDRPQRITSVVRSDQRTGKLVRSMVVSPRAVAEQRVPESVVMPHVVGAAAPQAAQEPVAPPTGIEEAVQRIAAEHSLPPQLIHSVIKVESNYNPNAISSKGALGLMQLIPATARRFGVIDAFNPVQNIQGGAKYLRYLLDLFDGSYPLALAAYNAGEAAVARYGGIPPYAETQNYVVLVRKQLEQAEKEAAAKVAPAPPVVAEAKETGPAHIVEEVQADGSVRYVSR
jgi:soluble lytic murein transglycosylase-like protein